MCRSFYYNILLVMFLRLYYNYSNICKDRLLSQPFKNMYRNFINGNSVISEPNMQKVYFHTI